MGARLSLLNYRRQLPLPEPEGGMLCDPMQLKACEAMLAYCGTRSGSSKPSSGTSAVVSPGSKAAWQTYDLPWTVSSHVSVEAMEEDPDNRPYLWDLED